MGNPILNHLIIAEKQQPLYSDFYCEQNNVIFPISVNITASDILRLCDGSNSKDDIVLFLSKKYNECEEKVREMVSEFLDTSQKMGYILYEKEANKRNVKKYGNREYWTPDLVAIELTHNCPLKCKHCYIDAGIGHNIDTTIVTKLIDECASMGVFQLQLTGGEPLVHPDFFYILDYAMNKKMSVGVFSSGYLCSDEVFDKLDRWKGNPRLSFQISVDGLSQYHNDFRGKHDSFENAIQFINRLVDLDIITYVGTCVGEQSYEELKELGLLIKKMGAKVYRISSITDRGRAKNNIKKLNIQKKALVKKYTKDLSLELNDEFFKVLFFEESDMNINYKYKQNCGLGQTVLKIDPTGNVYPCLLSDVKYASINNLSLSDLQKRYSRFWEKVHSPSELTCKDCENKELCSNCVCEGSVFCDFEESIFYSDLNKIKEQISKANGESI